MRHHCLSLALLLLLATSPVCADQAPVRVSRLGLGCSKSHNSLGSPRLVFGSCEVTDRSDTPLEAVELVVQFLDARGMEIPGATTGGKLGNLEPGQRRVFRWKWYNYGRMSALRAEVKVRGKQDGRTFRYTYRPVFMLRASRRGN